MNATNENFHLPPDGSAVIVGWLQALAHRGQELDRAIDQVVQRGIDQRWSLTELEGALSELHQHFTRHFICLTALGAYLDEPERAALKNSVFKIR